MCTSYQPFRERWQLLHYPDKKISHPWFTKKTLYKPADA